MEPVEQRVHRLLHDQGWTVTPDEDTIDRVHAGARRRRHRRTAVASGVTVAALAVGTGAIAWTTTQPGSEDPSVAVTTGDDHDNSDQEPNQAPSTQRDEPDTKMGQVEPREGGAPLPSTFDAASVTAVTPQQVWVLGGDRSAENATVAQTSDGGESFTGAGTIDAKVAAGDNEVDADTVRDIRFGSADDGWAYGGSLWSTHDGGETWQPSSGVDGQVVQLATTDDYAVALARTGESWSLWRSPTDVDEWSRLDESVDEPGDLVAAGTTIALSDRAGGRTEVLVSVDGETFDRRTSPCSADLGAGRLSATDDALWSLCATGTAGQLHVSTDDGASWRPASTGGTTLPNSGEVGARNASAAVVAVPGTPGRTVSVDADTARGNSNPRPVKGLTRPRYVGFTTEQVGYLLDQKGQLFRTANGGTKWQQLSIG